MALLDNRYPDRADMGGGPDVYERWGSGMTEQEREELIKKMSKAFINELMFDDGIRAALAVAEPVIREQADIALRAELAAVTERMSKLDFERTAAELERDALREENARLREALEPFAPDSQWIDPAIPDTRPIDVMVRAGELRAAAAAIRGKVKAEAACPAPDEAP
jgi:hypothetical protein